MIIKVNIKHNKGRRSNVKDDNKSIGLINIQCN